MKKGLFLMLSLAVLFLVGCSGVPSASNIKKDLMGKSTNRAGLQYWWDFEKTSEIKKIKIVNKVQSKEEIEYNVDLTLNDENHGKFFLNLTLTYVKVGDKWQMTGIYQNKYIKLD